MDGLQNIVFGGGLPGFPGGIRTWEDWQAFAKAVQTAGDPHALDFKAGLTGVPAIRLESIEATLRSVVEREESFRLFRRLQPVPAYSSVAEWATQVGIGGDLADAFHSETADIRGDAGQYKRNVLRVKYLMTRAEITIAALQQRTILGGGDDLKARENVNATLRILRALEWALFQGDEEVVPTQFNGIRAWLAREFPDHIFDLRGSSDTEALYSAIYEAFGRTIGPDGGFGKITDVYLSPTVQNDLDLYLAPQWRVPLSENPRAIEYGAPVVGIRTSYGDVATVQDVWIEDPNAAHLTTPAEVRTRGRISPSAPGAPGLTVSPVGSDPASRFEAGHAGTYYYAVAALGEGGEGPLSSIEAVTVAGGGGAELTITPPTGYGQTGYAIYRSTRNPATAPTPADLRLVTRIPAGSDPTQPVVWRDLNHEIPGSATVYLLDLSPEAIDWTQLMPMIQYPLAPVKATVPWAVLLFGALKLGIPQRHWVVKNYLPKAARWKPF
ncbi:hypothetical protein CSW25_07035 [Thermus scotoductus]|uniref:Uncharacterized protein n=11 Tax=Thermus scotoductus TaxID=37636 RepID=A0ABY0AIK4_THESC|nr:hypothetical protein [Thermus scotoductus]AYJ74840.1 hypothetical protein phiMa_57 [Thermus phage phiMa]RTG93484.1 hypothetical protein CSW49_10675 [Thermus scotoductus]RTH16271.1 hypothetical protein CSW39_09760 [Thermus scotoductus]RTH18386.1 hypothetical protein CSW42_08935 [Thermus scotoductus]RTH37393.1 hypothetical protein CSW34_08895 [Thermus scotoductus]